VLGLPAILAGHGGRLPLLSLIGYVGIFVTMTALNVTEGVVEAYVKPYLATHGGIPDSAAGLDMFENVALLFLVIGLICLGIAVIRARRCSAGGSGRCSSRRRSPASPASPAVSR
jgi:hypothetical protein